MNKVTQNKDPKHPIGVVSARTGIPQDLLRAWEKRYHAVVPGRGPTGRRLYTDEDIEKLRLLRRAVAAGRRISDVAPLSIEELRQLTKEDEAEISNAAIRRPSTRTTTNGHLEEALEALEDLDKDRFKRVLEEAAVSLSSPNLRQQVLTPLLHTIGDRWREGTLRVVHEHLASAIVRTFMEGLGNGIGKLPSAPRVVITTPSGQRHELGALLAAGAAEEHGWDVVYLGPDLPAEDIAAAVRHFKPKAVALSIVYKNGDVQVQDEFRRLARYLSADGTPIIVGGRAVGHLRSFFESLGVKCVEDLFEFQDELLTLDR
jgi:methanogenic corrinoid protein MtbC1